MITTASDGVAYQLVDAAGDSAAFDRHRATFEDAAQSFDFKAPSAAPAIPVLEVYEGENFTLFVVKRVEMASSVTAEQLDTATWAVPAD